MCAGTAWICSSGPIRRRKERGGGSRPFPARAGSPISASMARTGRPLTEAGGRAISRGLADRGKFKALVEDLDLRFRRGDDADIARRLCDQVAAAAARPVRTEIALLQTEGA